MPMSVQARLRNRLFELLYTNRGLYWFASTVPFAGQWRVWQRLALARLQGPEVLEVGCGIGTLLVELAEAGYHCRAVDRSPQMVAATRDRLKRAGLADSVEVTQGSVQRLPYADASFESVVSTFPTDYIADPAALAEIARVLRPGGRLIIVLGANLLPIGPVSFVLTLLHALVYGPGSGPVRRPSQAPDEASSQAAPHATPDATLPDAAPNVQGDSAGKRLPLAEAGLRYKEERVRSRAWEAYLVIAEKPLGIEEQAP
jgi:SAM-dependent methyltransferase